MQLMFMSKAGKFEIIMTPLLLPTILYIIDIPQFSVMWYSFYVTRSIQLLVLDNLHFRHSIVNY